MQTWGSFSDPQNPRNWPAVRKWTQVLLLTLHGTLSSVAATVLIAAAPSLAADLRRHDVFTPLLPTATYVLGMAVGPLVLAPLSEIIGRRWVYLAALAVFAALHAGCALAPNVWVLSALRLCGGAAGAAGPSLAGGSIGDLFARDDKGRAQALYGLGPTAGPIVGAVVGGIASYYKGWRWAMWAVTAAAGATWCAAALLQRETHAPYLLHRRMRQLRREYPELAFQTEVEVRPREVLRGALRRPFVMLFRSPICFLMSLYLSV